MNKTIHRWIGATLGLALVACGGGGGGGGGGETTRILVEGAWARAMPLVAGEGEAATNSAVYLLIRNEAGVGDRLMGATSEVAEEVEIHESKIIDDMMVMEKQDGLGIPAEGSVELKPGGLHIMLLGLRRPLLEGEDFELVLHFEKAGDLTLAVPVRPNARS